MITILLAALGVPLWLIAGALAGSLLSRRAFKQGSGVFRAKLRLVSGTTSGVKSSWPRRPVYAYWAHDVLLVHQGLALVRSRALPIARVTGSVTAGGPEEVEGLGPRPVLLALILDNGATVELAAPADAREAMVGPFAAELG